MENHKPNEHNLSCDYENSDYRSILYHIFYMSSHVNAHKAETKAEEDFRFVFGSDYRDIDKHECEYLNTIPKNVHTHYNAVTYLDKEKDLNTRYLKLVPTYYKYFREPFRSQIRNLYYVYLGLGSASVVMPVYWILVKQGYNFPYGTAFVILGVAIWSRIKVDRIANRAYKDMFSHVPQAELEKRINFLEENLVDFKNYKLF
jgi:hypothetical protein